MGVPLQRSARVPFPLAVSMLGPIERRQHRGAHVPPGHQPFVVLLSQESAGETDQGPGVRKDPDDPGPAPDLLVHAFQWVRRADLLPVGLREYPFSPLRRLVMRSAKSGIGFGDVREYGVVEARVSWLP
jgi:hypothetical protein